MKRRRIERKEEAKIRNQAWSELDFKEQLNVIDTRLGKGIGAKKQRAKIQSKINNPQVEVQRKAKKKKRGKNV